MTLTEEQSVVLTVLTDNGGPMTVADIAASSGWPSHRPYGTHRVARVLRELRDLSLVKRWGYRDGKTVWTAR